MAQRIILDTDIGTDVDDAYALAFLVNCPEVEIEAVTTVWVDPKLRARIARKLLNLLGRPDIPVAAGESMPLNPERHAFLMGHEGRGVFDGDEELSLPDTPAAAVIESLLRKYPHEIKVLLIGPQTNLGKLLSQKPELAALIKEFVIMGGLPFYGPKEMERFGEKPVDFNFVSDPEAARIVFDSHTPITMVGVNVTMPTLLRRGQIELVGKRATPATDLLYAMTMEWLKIIGQKETPMHDPLAVMAAFSLDFLDTMKLNVAIETKGELTAGLTVVNRCDNEEWNRVRVAVDVRSDDFIEFMLHRILA
ncbi:MAG: nucleoside hydrolase [Candidatus Hydrogenedentota bacterium]|nr:MAG: nucleoside hydrolase [Candidatus Hydrogenedentota bacterium]